MLKRSIKEQETKTSLLSSQINEDKKKYLEEIQKLSTDLKEKSQKCDKYFQEVADQKGENLVIKRKYELSLKVVYFQIIF